MANRLMVRNLMTLEKGPVELFMSFAVGAVGAPTLSAINSKGILSMSRTGVGAYTINLGSAVGTDKYQRLMSIQFSVIAATTTAVAMSIVQDQSNSSTPNVKVQFLDGTGAAVELANGVTCLIDMILSNSTAN